MEKSKKLLEAEMTIMRARLEITERLAREEIARLERENKDLRRPGFIIDAFCKILGITKAELLADSNLRWEDKLKKALLENSVATK